MATQLSITHALTYFSRKPFVGPGARAQDSQRLLRGVAVILLAASASVLIGCKEGITAGSGYGDDYQAGSPASTPSGSQSEEVPSSESSPEQSPSSPAPAPSPSDPAPAPAPSDPEPAPAPAPEPAPAPVTCTSTGLATQDLAGQCRSAPTTMGALEIGGSGGSSSGFAALSGTQTSRTLQVSWQPLGTNTSGYIVYFGKTAETANIFVSDVSKKTSVTYNAARDLGVYAGSVCFRIYAYDSARALSGKSTLVCTAV